MKAYLITTGTLFGLLTIVHFLRAIEEWPHIATDPWFLVITLVAAGLCVWALRLYQASRKPNV